MKKIVDLIGELILPVIIIFAAVVFFLSFDKVFFDNGIMIFLEGLVNASS